MPDSVGVESDWQLVQRMLAGDERAFEGFFEGASRGLFRFALNRLDNEMEAAEEVVQVTLTRALRKLHTYRGEAALFTWLCAICLREISAHRRRRLRRARELGLGDGAGLHPFVERRALEADAVTTRTREVAQQVQVALDTLPARYGDALEWKYLEEVPVEEVARRLGVGLKAAESLLTRARAAFRKAFTAVGLLDKAGPPRPA